MYVALVLIVRVLGQRLLSGMASYDLAAVMAFGGIIARAALGESPRLAGGIVALATLVVIRLLSGLLRRTRFGARLVVNRPTLLMAGARILEKHMSHCHVSMPELNAALRQSGIGSYDQVAAVVFEATGNLSVIRAGQDLDLRLLDGVVGAELLSPTDQNA